MMECNIILENGEIVYAEDENVKIEEVIACFSDKNYTLAKATFLLNEVKKELSRRAKI